MNYALAELELDSALLEHIERNECWIEVVERFGRVRYLSRRGGTRSDALQRRALCWLQLCGSINQRGLRFLTDADSSSKYDLRFYRVIVEEALEEGTLLVSLLQGSRQGPAGFYSIETFEAALFRLRNMNVIWHEPAMSQDVRIRVLETAFGKAPTGLGEVLRLFYLCNHLHPKEIILPVERLKQIVSGLASRTGLSLWEFVRALNPDVLEYHRLQLRKEVPGVPCKEGFTLMK